MHSSLDYQQLEKMILPGMQLGSSKDGVTQNDVCEQGILFSVWHVTIVTVAVRDSGNPAFCARAKSQKLSYCQSKHSLLQNYMGIKL